MSGPRALGLATALTALAVWATPAAAHHVGAWTPRDNEISANFKQLKFSIQAGKFDAAGHLFEAGAVRAEMRARSSRLPAGLEAATREAIQAGDARGTERWLMVFFAALARDLARDADQRLADPRESPEARVAAGRKFLDAIWRYYNLVDFAVTPYDSKAGVTIRLAFDEAEGYAKDPAGTAVTAPASPSSGGERRAVAAPDPAKMREPLRRLAQTLSGLIEASSTSIRRGT